MNPKRQNYENKSYEKWIREQPCVVCFYPKSECHHVGHARNNAYLSIPLCLNHHRFGEDSYHVLEHKKFEEKHNLNLDWEIIKKLCEYIELNRNCEPTEQLERE